MLDFLKNKTILVTGGTGSFGKNFVKYLLNNSEAEKIIVFSRDELKQSQMQLELNRDDVLRFFIGDVRDLGRLQRAFNKVDIVIHAAALKQVPTLEYNPFEAVKTNILGSQNVIDAAIDQRVEKVILISTDKAAQPANLYGSTKQCAEKLFVSGNSYARAQTKLSCVRYGNVIGSRGSIIEVLLNMVPLEKISITDEKMTRFWLTLEQSFELVIFALTNMEGGEIFVPKIPSMKLVDLFNVIAPQAEREIIGIRPGEKLHETLLTVEEARHAVSLDKVFIILPEYNFFNVGMFDKYFKNGGKLNYDFSYSSDSNSHWLTNNELIEIISRIKNESK